MRLPFRVKQVHIYIALAVLFSTFVLPRSTPLIAGSTKMTQAQYLEFLSKLDSSIPVWEHQIDAITLQNITADRREQAETQKRVALAFLTQVREKVRYEREAASLARQIYIHRDLSLAEQSVASILSLLPQAQQSPIAALMHDMGATTDRMFTHVISEADDVDYGGCGETGTHSSTQPSK